MYPLSRSLARLSRHTGTRYALLCVMLFCLCSCWIAIAVTIFFFKNRSPQNLSTVQMIESFRVSRSDTPNIENTAENGSSRAIIPCRHGRAFRATANCSRNLRRKICSVTNPISSSLATSSSSLFTLAFLVLALVSFHRCVRVSEKTHEKKWVN